MLKKDLENFYKDKKVLITGHTGFIGSWLTKWLIMLNSQVTGYSLDPHTLPNLFNTLSLHSETSDIRGDVRDTERLRKTIQEVQPEIVFHLAAQPIVIESYNRPVETFDINVTGTVNLLNELRKVDSLKTIIVVTSDKSYKNNEWVYPYRENDVLGGRDPYSASKSCQDIVVDSFRESYFLDSGIGISSIRAGNVIGGGDWAPYRIIPDIIQSLTKDEAIKIRNPNSVRPWQHVLEPISGMLMLAEKMHKDLKFSGPWNFGPSTNKGITVNELLETFMNYWNSMSSISQERKNYKEADYLQLDISKAKKELGWTPRYDFEKTLIETVGWYKAYYSKSIYMDKITEKQIEDYSSNAM